MRIYTRKENAMKKLYSAFLLVLVLCLALSSCSFINEMKQETEKVAEFTSDFTSLMSEPTVEKAEALVHPSSPLTPEAVIEKIENNEKLASLDFTGDISVSEIGEMKMSYHDETLGGNVYTVECTVTVSGTPINVSLTLLSSGDSFGLYDFDIK